MGLAEPMASLSAFPDRLSSHDRKAGAPVEGREDIPKTPSAAPAACIPELCVAPGEVMMQAQCEIQVHHHFSVFGFGSAFY